MAMFSVCSCVTAAERDHVQLIRKVKRGSQTRQVNPLAATAVDNYLEFYYFVGRIIGMAIFHQKLLDGYFILPFYKVILGILCYKSFVSYWRP